MGGPLASRLASGFDVLGYDPNQARAEEVAKLHGIRVSRSLPDLAVADTVVLCLPAPAISQQVCASLVPLMRGGLIIETSTVNPEDMTALHAITSPHGIGLVDAAIAAGVGQMAAGTAALLVGGADADVERAMPVLAAVAAKVVRLGPLGSGAALKVINNAVAHAVMVVLVEAAALAEANGVPRAKLIDLMTGNDAGLTRPLEHRLMERIANGDYEGGMSVAAARKDSTLALALAQASKVPVFAIGASHAVYEMALAEGKGQLDYAAIAQLWESWLGTSLSHG